jgi:hypothetical protein
LDNWRLRQALQLAQLESVRALSHLLQQPGSRLVHLQGEAGTANVLFRPGDWQEVILAARDLPQPVAGERYSLWLKLDNGEVDKDSVPPTRKDSVPLTRSDMAIPTPELNSKPRTPSR